MARRHPETGDALRHVGPRQDPPLRVCSATKAGWFHYSVDFRIGTRYMGEHIVDNFKREAMRNPFLRELLLDGFDLHRVQHNFPEFGAPLRPISASPAIRTRAASPSTNTSGVSASTAPPRSPPSRDAIVFLDKARDIYGYEHFICDTSGSLCEVVDPQDPADPVLTDLASATLPVGTAGCDQHVDELCRRFDRAPKPMYYPEEFLTVALGRIPPRDRPSPRPRSTPTPSSATASGP